MHSRHDHRVPMRFGEELATLIPDSRLVALSSNNHLLTAAEARMAGVPGGGRRLPGVGTDSQARSHISHWSRSVAMYSPITWYRMWYQILRQHMPRFL
jgi:hypothetical protein